MFYVVGITPNKYKVVTTTTSIKKAVDEQRKVLARHISCVIRDGNTGKRYTLANALTAFSIELGIPF
ncbi:hypothetical protein EI16_12380 [Hydrogenovibrio marinus]|uniref:Uncharacterized protein n=1 Tax=Hydrogenovibrio marinus TaxID=28885 RepID=A0A066ZR30_HYDMR|nr:hypothetical protein EI16_12380 [Hydrogenovibrio marinus]